jgi:hypothetical protein
VAWARIDDKFHSHPTLMVAGLDATGLFARAIAYCADYLTDGFVPRSWAEQQGGKKPVQKLIDAGLFIPVEGGVCIKDYLDWNPTRERVLADRERERGRRVASAECPPGSPGGTPTGSPRRTAARITGESGVCRSAPTPTPSPFVVQTWVESLQTFMASEAFCETDFFGVSG